MNMIYLKNILEVDSSLAARAKDSGKIVYFKSKEAKNIAVKSGSHTELDSAVDKKNKSTTNNMFADKSYQKSRNPNTKNTSTKNKKLSKRIDSEGNELKNIKTKNGSTIFGVEHDNIEGAKQVVDDVKNLYPKDTKIVFMGEGGDSNGNYVKGSEQEFIHNELKKHYPNFTNESWDGDEMDVYNDQSELYAYQKKKTGLPHNIILAGNWANMVGQGDNMAAEDYLDDEGKQFLQDAAKEAGFPPIKNWDKPTKRDRDTLYRLSFPQDYGDKETKVNDIQVAFNDARDENLIRKMKKYESEGYKVVSTAGNSHIDLIKKRKSNN